MDELSKLAIVIPAYNAGNTIGDTLSALTSCHRVHEIGRVFLCDDASTDDTIRVGVESWKSDVQLTILRNEKNLGERRTVNRAFEKLKNKFDWILLLHADDIVKENWIELYLQAMSCAGSKTASICSSYDCWYSDTGKIERGEDKPAREIELIAGSRKSVVDTLARGCWWHISGCAIRTNAFSVIGGFRPDLPQLGDFEWLLRCLRSGYSVEYIPRTTMRYRMHEKSISSLSFAGGRDLRERLDIFKEYRDQGYLSSKQWNATRVSIAYTATKRLIKNILVGDIRRMHNLFAVVFLSISGNNKARRTGAL